MNGSTEGGREGGKRGTSERKSRRDGYKREGGRKWREGRRRGQRCGGIKEIWIKTGREEEEERRDLYKEVRKDKRGQQPRKERLGGNNVEKCKQHKVGRKR